MSTGVLASFWYYQRYDFGRIPEEVPLILDSGAFSAFTQNSSVNIDEYGQWVTGMTRPYDFAFNLDVLGNEQRSLDHWRTLHDAGVPVVPVIHYGSRAEDVLPSYLDEGADRVALGGIAVSGAGQQVTAWCAHVFKWLRDNSPTTTTHGLGVHMRSRLASLPWSTTDSSTFTGAWRFARLYLWEPYTKRWHTVPLDGRALYRFGRACRFYGFEPEQVALSTPETREDLVRFATRSECRAAEDWNTRHKRTVRRYATSKPSVGEGYGLDLIARQTALETSRYVVDGSSEHLEWAADTLRYLASSSELAEIAEEADQTPSQGTLDARNPKEHA